MELKNFIDLTYNNFKDKQSYYDDLTNAELTNVILMKSKNYKNCFKKAHGFSRGINWKIVLISLYILRKGISELVSNGKTNIPLGMRQLRLSQESHVL